MFKKVGEATDNFTPINTHCEQIWHEVLHPHNISTYPTPKEDVMDSESRRWCKLHRVKGHHIEDFYQLNKEIEWLIQKGHLKKYVKRDSCCSSGKSGLYGQYYTGSPMPNKTKDTSQGKDNKTTRHTLNTMEGGFFRGREIISIRVHNLRGVN